MKNCYQSQLDQYWKHPAYRDDYTSQRHHGMDAAPVQEHRSLWRQLWDLRGQLWWFHISSGRYEQAQIEYERITKKMHAIRSVIHANPTGFYDIALALVKTAGYSR